MARNCPALAGLLLILVSLPLMAASPCGPCHEDAVAAFSAGPHAATIERDARLCNACHGDATKHLASSAAADIVKGEEILRWSGERQAEACASCHAAQFPAWRKAAHTADGLCWNCHAAEATHRQKKSESENGGVSGRRSFNLCTDCHRDTAAQFRMHYRHPVESGQLSCESCHDTHGRSATGVNTIADTKCLACHEEQNGPFLFAHGAMENGCTSCHSPHGSPHRAQLKSAGNGTCLACHLQTNFPSIGAASHDFRLSGGGRCWDCHSEVHGSNTTNDFNPRGRR